jgi:hypothetical protein
LFFNFIKYFLIFCLIFQNVNVPVISAFQWLKSAVGESRETFDVIVSTKHVLFKSGFGGEAAAQKPAAHTTNPPLPPPLGTHRRHGYTPDSQNTCPNESLGICGVFLYGVKMILILLCKVCEDMLDNYRNLEVRTHRCIDRLGL